MTAPPSTAPSNAPDKGMAALTVVMIIFFVMALVAAYTNRNLIFEQRISANSYKSARALDAAEAAIDWTLSMLNGGVVTDNCTAPSAAALAANPAAYTDFRRRLLTTPFDPTVTEGSYDRLIIGNDAVRMYPACIMDASAGLSCICPSPTSRNPSMGTPNDGIGSAFNVELEHASDASAGLFSQPGAVNISAQGCANIGTGGTSCYNQNPSAQSISVVDAKSGINMTVALVRALPLGAQAPGHPQLSTLTTGGAVQMNGFILTVANSTVTETALRIQLG